MSEQVIWSTNATRDHISGMSDEEKFNALVDRGYDPEMLGGANIDDVIAKDDYMWQDDVGDFDEEIAPMLNNQTRSGVILMVNENGDGKAAYAEDLKGGDIDPNVYDVEIVYDGDGLVWKGHGKGVDKEYMLFAVPENEESFKGFVKACLASSGYYVDDANDPSTEDEITDEIIDTFDMEDEVQLLNSYCDWSKVGAVCPRLQPYGVELSADESLNEAKTNNKEQLQKELDEIKPLADEYGFTYFTSMPFTAFEGDPEAVETQFPEFFKVCKAFFTEMGIIDKAEAQDTDMLDELWDTNIDQHDWDTIVRTCELMIEHDNGSQQIEKVYKNGYATLDDDQIKADREKQDELAAEYGESLETEAKEQITEKLVYGIYTEDGEGRREVDRVDSQKRAEARVAELGDGYWWDELDESLNEELYSREEDVAIEADTPEEVIAELDVPEGIVAEVVEMEGPGAGWPVVRFSGDKAKVDAYLAEMGFEDLDEKVNMNKLRDKMMNEDTITDEDEIDFDDAFGKEFDDEGNMIQSDDDLAAELAAAYKHEWDGSPEKEQEIYDDIVTHFEDADYAEKVIDILKSEPVEEAYDGEKDLKDRYARAAEKYRRYAGLDKDEELEEDLSEQALNRVCYEENLSMEELKGALGR